ncbi:hypothetical protein [Effusibacillus consociatus]|uniref:Uncharacterized protein n=1 Tax=Effusibacillus consociatus TaxID=1117041 RepID=A0ABV9PYL6_9BACL
MYDPTIFDNLKVVLEGGLYDLDREGRIRISGREDRVDLASMGRSFRMQFLLSEDEYGTAEVELSSSLADFASELARLRLVDFSRPGCRVQIRYRFPDWNGDESKIRSIENALQDWWSEEVHIQQSIEVTYRTENSYSTSQQSYMATITFLKKIDEDHIEELQALLEHTVASFKKIACLLR